MDNNDGCGLRGPLMRRNLEEKDMGEKQGTKDATRGIGTTSVKKAISNDMAAQNRKTQQQSILNFASAEPHQNHPELLL